MNKICVETYELPSSWAPYLINGDDSGYETSEIEAIGKFCRRNGLPASASSCDGDSDNFKRYHDATPEMPLAANCETFTFLLPYVPFVIRRKYFADLKKWELFAVFPTIAADSANWYNMQAEAENGDSFSCSADYIFASRHVRGFDPALVAAFEKRVRRQWESDSGYPCRLLRYERIQSRFNRERENSWKASRA